MESNIKSKVILPSSKSHEIGWKRKSTIIYKIVNIQNLVTQGNKVLHFTMNKSLDFPNETFFPQEKTTICAQLIMYYS